MLHIFLAQAQSPAPTGPGGGIGFFVPFIFIFIAIYFLISRRGRKGQEQQQQQQQKLGSAGRLLVGVGLVIGGYFLFLFDTSVEVESHYIAGYGNIGGGRVNNLGRMQDRSLGCFAGIAIAVVGAIMIISDKNS